MSNSLKFIVVHGPNLNLLGERKPEIYGYITLDEINSEITKWGTSHGVELRFYQSNHEGELIDFIQNNRKWAHGLIINPAAYTHTSIAIRDVIEAVDLPTVEVHLTDPTQREDFRKNSFIESLCIASFRGLGWMSYMKGCDFLLDHLKEQQNILTTGKSFFKDNRIEDSAKENTTKEFI